MKPVILAMTMAAALAAYWITEEADCLLTPETDACLCVDDCLSPGGETE